MTTHTPLLAGSKKILILVVRPGSTREIRSIGTCGATITMDNLYMPTHTVVTRCTPAGYAYGYSG